MRHHAANLPLVPSGVIEPDSPYRPMVVLNIQAQGEIVIPYLGGFYTYSVSARGGHVVEIPSFRPISNLEIFVQLIAASL